jgi:hypothetical protein
MAVTPEKIKARLKALYPKANLSTKRLDAYAAKLAPKPADDADDDAIDAIINDYNEVIDFEAVAKEDDRVRTLDAKAKADAEKAKGKGGKGDDDDDDDEEIEVDKDAPAWAKALLKKNKSLSSEIESLKTGKIVEQKRATASELFGKSEVLKNIPENIRKNWENRIDVNSDTPFEDQIKALETEYGELTQTNANNNQYAPAAGGGGPAEIKADDAVVAKMVGDL